MLLFRVELAVRRRLFLSCWTAEATICSHTFLSRANVADVFSNIREGRSDQVLRLDLLEGTVICLCGIHGLTVTSIARFNSWSKVADVDDVRRCLLRSFWSVPHV